VYRARQSGAELDPETYARLTATLATHETEAARLEQQLHDLGPEKPAEKAADTPPPPSSPPPATSASASSTPPPPDTPTPEAPAM
jgi:hypothetical protein